MSAAPSEVARPLRIRDAAVLLVVDTSGPAPCVLMGRRHGSMAFMANKVVFPGGRVDAADHRLAVPLPLNRATEAALERRTGKNPSATLAKALALAAIREAAEEAGALLAHAPVSPAAAGISPIRSRSPLWSPLLRAGHVPAVDRVHFFGRAITPPGRSRRFDTRFFLADAANLATDADASADGELGGVSWISFADARSTDLVRITRIMLDEAERRLPDLQNGDITGDLPFYYCRHGRHLQDWIYAGGGK